MQAKGQLRPLNYLVEKYRDTYDIEDGMLIRFGDDIAAIAFMVNAQHLFYRKDIFEENNVAVLSEVSANDTWVAGTGNLTGHQQGNYLGLAPTGLPVKMRFSDFWLVVDGKLKENWVMVDHVDTFRQLGVDLMAVVRKRG